MHSPPASDVATDQAMSKQPARGLWSPVAHGTTHMHERILTHDSQVTPAMSATAAAVKTPLAASFRQCQRRLLLGLKRKTFLPTPKRYASHLPHYHATLDLGNPPRLQRPQTSNGFPQLHQVLHIWQRIYLHISQMLPNTGPNTLIRHWMLQIPCVNQFPAH